MARSKKRSVRTHARSHSKLVKKGRRRRVSRNVVAAKRTGKKRGTTGRR